MRISDWSSDVCSSDLNTGGTGAIRYRPQAIVTDDLAYRHLSGRNCFECIAQLGEVGCKPGGAANRKWFELNKEFCFIRVEGVSKRYRTACFVFVPMLIGCFLLTAQCHEHEREHPERCSAHFLILKD